MPPAPVAAKWPSPKERHERRCFYLAITSPEKVARLWEAERVRLEALRAANRPGRGARPRGRESVRKKRG